MSTIPISGVDDFRRMALTPEGDCGEVTIMASAKTWVSIQALLWENANLKVELEKKNSANLDVEINDLKNQLSGKQRQFEVKMSKMRAALNAMRKAMHALIEGETDYD